LTSLAYTEITGTFNDGSGTPLTGTVTFTPSQTVYSSGVPVAMAGIPVQCDVISGQLQSQAGNPVQLLATDNSGLAVESLTGWWFWTVALDVQNAAEPGWSFFLPSSPSSVELYSLARSAPPGAADVQTITAADASITVGGTAQDPTVETGTLDEIAALHPAAAAVTVNGQKVTHVANGSASTDAVAFGQLGTAAFASTSAFDAAGAATSAAGAALATAETYAAGVASTAQSNAEAASLPVAGGDMAGWLAPKVVPLTDAATVAVSAALGNDFRLTLTTGIGGSRAIGAPTNPSDGQQVVFAITQPASGGPCTVTWNAAFGFGATGAPTLTTTASATDLIAFKYYGGSIAKWRCVGAGFGY
jgi:hypothetical protein